MIEHARNGKRVVRLKSGDPLIFGRAAEEMAALTEAGVAFEVVPGITAAFAAAAAIPCSLTDRNSASNVTFSTGHHAAVAQRIAIAANRGRNPRGLHAGPRSAHACGGVACARAAGGFSLRGDLARRPAGPGSISDDARRTGRGASRPRPPASCWRGGPSAMRQWRR